MPERLAFLREVVTAVAVVGAALWAIARFVLEPHVRRVVKSVMAEETKRLAGIGQRLQFVEDAVNELRRDGKSQDEELSGLRSEMTQGFQRLTATLERIDENAQVVAQAVARIEGRMEARGPRNG